MLCFNKLTGKYNTKRIRYFKKISFCGSISLSEYVNVRGINALYCKSLTKLCECVQVNGKNALYCKSFIEKYNLESVNVELYQLQSVRTTVATQNWVNWIIGNRLILFLKIHEFNS